MSEHIKITALIVDDASQARELLSLMLKELAPTISIVGEAENLEQAIELVWTKKPDVVFLDIEMPGKSGLQLIEEVSREEVNYDVVFITAYNQYAIQAFRLSAIDYLLKPVREKELQEAISRIRERKSMQFSGERLKALAANLSIQSDNTICIPVNYGYEYLLVNEIEYLEADGAYTHILLKDGKRKTVSKNLGYFEDALQHLTFFIKVHRSCIINIHYISSFLKADRGTIVLKGGKEVSLSRSCRDEFFERIKFLS